MKDDERPIHYDKRGSATFHLDRILRLHNAEQRDADQAARDLAGLGVGALVPDPKSRPPMGGMGDIHSQVTEPGQRYWEQWRQDRASGIITPVALEPAEIPVPPELAKYAPMIQKWVNQICCCAKQEMVYNQPHPHLAPQVTAITVDVFTGSGGVQLPGAYPGPGACVPLIQFQVPDRFIVILERFGNELESANAWGDVVFSMQRNATPLRSYGDFDVQLGRFVDPTRMGSPIILKHKDNFILHAQSKSGQNHTAFSRVMGWAFAVNTITSDGTYKEFLTSE
ncbi:MAG: hypothetical protein ACRDZ4_14575 [Egibacteraceae bacterium]